ncbi:unnamed protein product, partial [Ranitomeya imitator]
NTVSSISGHAKPAASVATVRPLVPPKKEEGEASTNEKRSSEDKHINEEEGVPASEKEKLDKPLGKHHGGGGGGIKKDDEFFHFIIVCFALGAVLVCEYYYSDWTVSAGVGLITFATLETIGIYFRLIHRIRTVVEQFLPLVGRFTLGKCTRFALIFYQPTHKARLQFSGKLIVIWYQPFLGRR